MVIMIPMQECHVEEVAKLEPLCFAVPWSEKAFYIEMKNNLACYSVVIVDDKVVGYGGFWNVLNEGHITNIAIHPDYRRQGLATALMKYMIFRAEEKNVNEMDLEVRVSNEAAISLYKKFGFAEVGVRKGYYSDNGEDALLMKKQWEIGGNKCECR